MQMDITNDLGALKIGASGVEEIIQNVKIILNTVKGSVPLDRSFGVSGDFLDKPLPLAKVMFTREIVSQVELQEPRVSVSEVLWDSPPEGEMDGRLYPRVRIALKEEI